MSQIAIVGAGIAGLNAALTLHDSGLSCDLYEASARVGGRMHSNATSWAEGIVSEYCGEFIDSDHKTIRQLIQRFGLEITDLGRGRLDHTQSILYFFKRFYGAQDFERDFQVLAPILQQQMQQVGCPTTYQSYTETGYHLDQMSIYDWIEHYVEGGHKSPLGRMLDLASTGFYGLDSQQQSSLSLLYMFGPRTLEYDTSVESPLQGSSRITGGNELLPQAIARSLPPASLHLRHQLRAIKRTENDLVALSFATPAGPLEVQYEHVILALPFSTLRRVDYRQAGFDTLKETAITELGYGTISKLALQFDTPYWFQKGPWPQANNGFIITDLAIQTLWDASPARTGSTGMLINYTSGHIGAAFQPASPYTTTADSAEVQHYARQCLEQLEQIFPGISSHYTGTAVLSYPTGDPFLLGSYSCLLVGQYTRFFGYEGMRQGPIHFAGEHCSVEWPGYMEGAALEGARAAEEIIQDFR